MPPPPTAAYGRRPPTTFLGMDSNSSSTFSTRVDKGKRPATDDQDEGSQILPFSLNMATYIDSARTIGSQRPSHSTTSVGGGGNVPLESGFGEGSPRPPSVASSINTIRSDRFKDHARIFPKRLRTSTGCLKDAYAGRHTPVLGSANFNSGWESPALSINSSRGGLPNMSTPGSVPSTPKVPVSRGEVGYMGKQTYIAFSKGVPRSASMGYLAAVNNMHSNLSRHSSYEIHMVGSDARRVGSLDSTYYSSPTNGLPAARRAASSGILQNEMEAMYRSGGPTPLLGSPKLPMTREAAAAEEDRLDQELRALRRQSMANDVHRSQSAGCLTFGSKGGGGGGGGGSNSFDASVPASQRQQQQSLLGSFGRKRTNSSPSFRSIRSFMSPILGSGGGGGGGIRPGSHSNDNNNKEGHAMSRPNHDPRSPAVLSSPNLGDSLYKQQSYSQVAQNQGERKGGLRSVFSTPNLTTSTAATTTRRHQQRAPFSFRSALSSLISTPAAPPSPDSVSTPSPTTSTDSDMILSPPLAPSAVGEEDEVSGSLRTNSENNGAGVTTTTATVALLSAEELIQAELTAIEFERIEREQAAAATAAAAVEAMASMAIMPTSPQDAMMEEVQPQDGRQSRPDSVLSDVRSRASSVMSTDTDASSSTGSSAAPSNPPGPHLLSRPSAATATTAAEVATTTPGLQTPLRLPRPPPSQLQLLPPPPGHPEGTERGDGANLNRARSKRSIQIGHLKKMFTKPFSFASAHWDSQRGRRAGSSPSSAVPGATSPNTTVAQSSQGGHQIRFPVKDEVSKFQWDYRRHVNPLHDDP